MALRAQGFARPRPGGRVDVRHIRKVIQDLGLLQLDFVNVLVPAHYQVLFSRLGPFSRELLDRAVYQGKDFTEQWAHEASIIPIDLWPVLRHRMESHRVRPWGFEDFMADHPEFVESVYQQVKEKGPLSADEIHLPESLPRRSHEGAWSRSIPRCVLEAFFGRGEMVATERRKNFARSYDLAERVVPPEYRKQRIPAKEARRELLLRAARGLGVGSAGDLADYFRMPIGKVRPLLEELVAEGALVAGEVEGWEEEVYLHPEATIPREISAHSLISPFDPLIWHRSRVARLFGFDYRLEIFVPAHKRRWGYYVLPFLMGEELVARVDLKADRKAGRLRVLSAHLEPAADLDRTASHLAPELQEWAKWLELDAIEVKGKQPLESRLRSL